MKRLCLVNIESSPSFWYAVGLIATDGSLSIDGRHLDFTSKDRDLVFVFRECLGLKNKVGKKTRGSGQEKMYYRIQFGDKNFYEFLLSIGFMPNKSTKLGDIKIDKRYFADFLRGCIDGDGSIGAFRHPESEHPQIRLRLASASTPFLMWVLENVKKNTTIAGGWIRPMPGGWVLVFGKADALELLRFMYYTPDVPCLARKAERAKKFLQMQSSK